MNMSFDFSSIKSMSLPSLEDSIISEKNIAQKRSKKIIIQNLIKKHKKEKNSCQEIYRNEQKKSLQLKTTKDNTFTLTSESSLNNKKYDKFINKKISFVSTEETKNISNKENEEDIIFLKKVLRYHNFSSSNNKIKKNKIKLNDLRKYIIKIEKKIKDEENILFEGSISDFMKEINNLIARFSLIIFILAKNQKLEQAKEIFLLLLKENMKYFDYIEKNIIKTYYMSPYFPKETYELIRIYAFIIKYSQFFNMTYNCNIFLGRYLEIIYYIYNWFKFKANNRCFTIDIKNQINFWFSLALHNISYFSISYYFPIKVSINLNNNIMNIYKNLDENNLSISEKLLIIKVLYNLSLSYYLNAQNERALDSLDDAREKILNIEDCDYTRNSVLNKNNQKKDSVYIICSNYNKNDNLSINNEDDGNRLSTANSFSEFNNFNSKEKNDNDNMDKLIEEEKVKETFLKDKINLEDIKLLINYGYKSGLIKETNSGNVSLTNISSISLLYKKLPIPKYLKNPLLRKIELLIGEIEIDKRNYKLAYEHILQAFYILIILKLNKKAEESIKLNNEQKIIGKYLSLIEKLKEKGTDNIIEEKTENNSEEITLYEINQSIIENINDDSKEENDKEELGDIINDKYNLNLSLNKDDERKSLKKEFLVCGEKELDLKILKDMEKFLIFLCSLSLYQINVLNETQPDDWKRNDLPILFSSQFKDCLSNNQRIELDSLQTMALNRDTILKDPNFWIIPSNLNISITNKKEMEKNILKRTKKFINKFYEESNKNIQIRDKKEYKLYQKILKSGKITRDIKEYMNNNLELVLKVLKKIDKDDIEKIIESPNILIEPVKKYKRKRKKYLKQNNIKKNNYMSYYNLHKNIIDYRMSTRGFGMFKSKLKLEPNSSLNSKDEIIKNDKDDTFQRLSCKKDKKNKSKLGQSFNIQLYEDKPKKRDTRDYNDNYKEIQISIDSSLNG